VGTGTQTLTGSNTYSAGTTVNDGTLMVNYTSGSATGTGAVIVNSGGTLAGTGIIAPTGTNGVTINGNLSPGASIGKLTFGPASATNTLDLSGIGTGALKFDLNTATTDGTGSDIVKLLAGTLNIGTLDFAEFSFMPGGSFGPGTYTLFDASSPITGSIGVDTGSIAGFAAQLSMENISNFDVLLTVSAVSAVPEASAFLTVGLGGILALGAAWIGKRIGFAEIKI
jgi:fibronectin-binding autotransporter adhesin